jgi:hypothetical protein
MASHRGWSHSGEEFLMNITVRARGTNAFHIELETIQRLRKFHKAHPDIDQNFLDRELNIALNKMVSRMEREYYGLELSPTLS